MPKKLYGPKKKWFLNGRGGPPWYPAYVHFWINQDENFFVVTHRFRLASNSKLWIDAQNCVDKIKNYCVRQNLGSYLTGLHMYTLVLYVVDFASDVVFSVHVYVTWRTKTIWKNPLRFEIARAKQGERLIGRDGTRPKTFDSGGSRFPITPGVSIEPKHPLPGNTARRRGVMIFPGTNYMMNQTGQCRGPTFARSNGEWGGDRELARSIGARAHPIRHFPRTEIPTRNMCYPAVPFVQTSSPAALWRTQHPDDGTPRQDASTSPRNVVSTTIVEYTTYARSPPDGIPPHADGRRVFSNCITGITPRASAFVFSVPFRRFRSVNNRCS